MEIERGNLYKIKTIAQFEEFLSNMDAEEKYLRALLEKEPPVKESTFYKDVYTSFEDSNYYVIAALHNIWNDEFILITDSDAVKKWEYHAPFHCQVLDYYLDSYTPALTYSLPHMPKI